MRLLDGNADRLQLTARAAKLTRAGFKSLEEADAAVKREMERLALERKNLVENVKKLDQSMLALRAAAAAGTSPAVSQSFPGVLQSLAGVRHPR